MTTQANASVTRRRRRTGIPPFPAPRAARRGAALVAAVLAACAAMFVVAGPAAAHAVLVSSDPRAGANLPAAPAQVSVTFDEAVGLRPGYLRVIDGSGRRVDTGTAFHPAGRDDVVAVRLRGGLGQAAYVASYRVISADSHPVSGAVQFTVGGAAPVTARPGGNPTDRVVSILFDAARSVTFIGLALFGGAWLVLVLVLRRPRGAGPSGEPSGGPSTGPERVRWWRTVWLGAIVAAAGLAVEFLLQGPYAAGDRVTAALDPAPLGDTASSAFGRWHLSAIALLAALAVTTFRGVRPGAAVARGLVVLAGAAWLAVLTGVAASGHAGVRSPVWLGLPVTVAHLLAMSTWIGGLAVLVTVVLPDVGRAVDAGAAHRVLPLFSRVAMACVATLALTGTYQAWQEVGSWSALFDTTYGELVLTKVELFAVLVALGAVARSQVAAWPTARTAGADGDVDGQDGHDSDDGHDGDDRTRRRAVTAATRLRTGVLLELGLAVAVLCVSGVLVAEPPGRDAALASQPTANGTVTVTAQLSVTRTVTVRVNPARHGPVTVELTVSPGAAVQQITLAATQNAAGVGPLPIALRAAAGTGEYRSTPVDLPVAGDWQFTISVQTSAFSIATATPTVHLT